MGALSNIFGSKPDVPTLPGLTLPEEQQKAIQANIAAAPGAAQLARLSQDQIKAMMNFAIPGFDTITGQASSNIQSLLKGEIPTDVSQQVTRSGAARALTGGFGGSGMAGNLVARDLGLTSLGLTQQGLTSAQSWLNSMEALYAPSQALYSGMFITPQQEFAASTQERDLQFQRNWLQNQIKAMPDPIMRGLYDTTMEIVGDVLSIYSGGAKHQSYQPNYGGGGGGGNMSGWGGAGGWQMGPGGGGNSSNWGGGGGDNSFGSIPGRSGLGDLPIPGT